ncbi:hypothetical protein D3C75_1208520 [compost metagenome]
MRCLPPEINEHITFRRERKPFRLLACRGELQGWLFVQALIAEAKQGPQAQAAPAAFQVDLHKITLHIILPAHMNPAQHSIGKLNHPHSRIFNL